MISAKLAQLKATLLEMGSIVVGFSGGVDSTLLLKVANHVLGEKVLAVTVASELSSRRDAQDVAVLVQLIGAPRKVVECNELDDPVFTANSWERCYHCKAKRFRMLTAMAADLGYNAVVDGTNRDDHDDYRPVRSFYTNWAFAGSCECAIIVPWPVWKLNRRPSVGFWRTMYAHG